ncbi:MAG: ABC transporter permease [Spirochaetales bacterium]|nr:MAG: ABC transporter permease [Spirochaetales bacterium]
MVSGIKKASWRNMVKNLYVVGILIFFVVLFTIISPKFVRIASLVNILRAAAPTIMVATAVTLLMISGHVDLSVGSMLGFCGVFFAVLCKSGIPVVTAALLTTIIGGVIGIVNGLLVVKLKIIPVIATLATMSLLLGIAKLLTGDTIPYVKGNLPKAFTYLGRGSIGGIPVQLFIIIVIIAIFVILEKRSILGKYSIAIGGNKIAASLSGINVNAIIWTMYILVGIVGGFAGVVKASNLTIADATAGAGFELDVIIAVLLGGTSFQGGEGSVLRTVVGAFILVILGIGMNFIGVPPFYQYVVKGVVLIVAILLDTLVKEQIAE